MRFFILTAMTLVMSCIADATEPNWKEGTDYPLIGLSNPYQLSSSEHKSSTRLGRIHALSYPVEVTGTLLPFEPVKTFIEASSENPLRRLVELFFQGLLRVKSFDQMSAWLGLHTYPDNEHHEAEDIPYPDGERPDYRMGISLMETENGTGFTISCAACHSANLFGRKVIGLTNRFPRANEFFTQGIRGLRWSSPFLFRMATGATAGETRMLQRTKENLKFIDSKLPLTLGLDTSLAHVALSLARRAPDAYATKDVQWSHHPRTEPLANFPADSKPAVWWNVKYKNRWLLDGSVVSGNPIYTNLIWNEIGRGTDLFELENWLDANPEVVRDLTNAVFNNEPPHITEFFPAERINLASAKRGERVFLQRCARCHGTYEKAWNLPIADQLSHGQKLKTTRVEYHRQTPVYDVGTDSHRYKGMESLVQLNDLAISKNNGIQIRLQNGYVPPPLVGIWARWPYFHNNSIPNLCALLQPASQRPENYWAGEAINPQRDFDFECNGYPVSEMTPEEWKNDRARYYDTTRPGMSNSGHDENILVRDGHPLLSQEDKLDLIQYLQTL